MTPLIRRFEPRDIAAAYALQCEAYPDALHDSPAAFMSRLDFADGLSLVAEHDGALAGYILAHPWPAGSPPPVDAILTCPAGPGLVHYVHDMTLARGARGSGLSRQLFEASAARAREIGLRRAELVAVGGAAVFWVRLGFMPVDVGAGLRRKLSAYGTDAVYMAR